MFVIAVLLTCSSICLSHYYAKGFDRPNPNFCYCADKIGRKDPIPLEINLQWKRSILPEDRKAEVSEPTYPQFPRYQISEPSDE